MAICSLEYDDKMLDLYTADPLRLLQERFYKLRYYDTNILLRFPLEYLR
jgi:hypothetical protein